MNKYTGRKGAVPVQRGSRLYEVIATSFYYTRNMRAGGKSSPRRLICPPTLRGQCAHYIAGNGVEISARTGI